MTGSGSVPPPLLFSGATSDTSIMSGTSGSDNIVFPVVDIALLTETFLAVGALLTTLCASDSKFGSRVQHSLHVIEQALDMFTPLGIAVSFNGGKDACVALFLLMIVLARKEQLGYLCGSGMEGKKMRVVYFEKDEFPAVRDFLDEVCGKFGLTLTRYREDYKEGMRDLVENKNIKGVLMGQRYGDPWTNEMRDFEPSTPGWPEFQRVNPILKWTYSQVWKFLRGCDLPYCPLYGQGYTSLGEAKDTVQNIALLKEDGTYMHAADLHDESLERSNRTPTANSPATRVQSCSPANVKGASGGENSEKILKKSAFDFSELDGALEKETESCNKNEDL